MTAAVFAPTVEQETARSLFGEGGTLAIEAGAGTGKTSTLRLLGADAEARRAQGQYVAFNRSIVQDARGSMPGNVDANTAHSLAMRAVGGPFRARLDASRRLRSDELARILHCQPLLVQSKMGRRYLRAGTVAGLVMKAITRFCASADPAPGPEHVAWLPGLEDDQQAALAAQLVEAMGRAWEDLTDPRGVLPYSPDHYLKLWQLSAPLINRDFILFDEAQDASPVMLAIIEAQAHAQQVYVGDGNQQIYEWRGAINALESIDGKRCYLTRSFRFGHAIAEVANRILADLPTPMVLVGHDPIDSRIVPVPNPDAVLTRTNATAVQRLITSLAAGTRAHLVGGGHEVARFVRSAEQLIAGRGPVEHPDLACFNTWGEVQAYVEADELGDEIRLLVSLVDEFGATKILQALELQYPDEAGADLVISTAHKAKGREWDRVQLTADFAVDDDLEDEELRLLYVAVTRARLELDITALPLLDDQPQRPDAPARGWTCSTCGPHPDNGPRWCAVGCGSDYQAMVPE